MLVNYGPASQFSSSEFLHRVSQLEKSDYEQTTKLAQIEGTVDGITSTVSKQTENINGISGQTSILSQTVSDFTARIEKVEGANKDYTEIKATLDGLTITTKNGKTIIDGGNIDATNLNLTGAITFNQLDSSLQTTINGVVTDSGDALTKALNAETKVDNMEGSLGNISDSLTEARDIIAGWVYPGTTYIDGSEIKTGTITASKLQGGTINLLNSSATAVGTMSLTGAQTSNFAVEINSKGALRMVGNNGAIYFGGPLNSTGIAGLKLQDNYVSLISCTSFHPSGTASNLGDDDKGRFQCVYLYSSPNVTSDRNQKHDIEYLEDKYLSLFDNLIPRRFKMNTGTSNRYHVGFIAQEVEDAMIIANIDSQEFGGFVKSESGLYSLRYDEFIGILAAKIKQLESRIEQLEA